MSTVNTTNVKNAASPVNNIELSTTGDTTIQSLNTGPLAGFRNQLINGNMRVSQRGSAGQANVSQVYTCDRWYVHSDGNYTWDKVAATADMKAAGLTYALRIRNAASIYQIRQCIELPDTGEAGVFVSGSKWTISIYSNSPVNAKVDFRITSAGSASDVTEVIPSTAMTSLGGSRYSLSFTFPSVAPQATAECLAVSFTRTDGTTAAIQVSGAQFENGLAATPYEVIPIQTQLVNCQRYFIKVGPGNIGPVSLQVGTADRTMGNTMAIGPMRKTPTFENNAIPDAKNTVELLSQSGSSPKTATVSSVSGKYPITLNLVGEVGNDNLYMYRPNNNEFWFDAEF